MQKNIMSIENKEWTYIISVSRRTGEHCDVTCHKGFTASFSEIICTLSGAWDRNSDDICAESYEEKNLASIGIGLSTSVVVIAITIVAIVCIVRRRKPPGNECEEPRVENPHSTFINGGYLTGVESYSTSQETPTSCMYNSIDDSHFTQYDEGVIDTHL
ncbi:uncharacterized protein LOC130052098 [Ostrea edulis]|uniref:uncharacterized protein LOC130052098 n=1 Tax=Ostrea edulis TaxID=37623 RepID=UPI0024AFBFA4|nr:uncharacterized protein LOC130052098 [Ostrea edulis]